MNALSSFVKRDRATAAQNSLGTDARRCIQGFRSEVKFNHVCFARNEDPARTYPRLGGPHQEARERGLDLNDFLDENILDSIHRAALRLEQIVNDFLDVGRIEQGASYSKKRFTL